MDARRRMTKCATLFRATPPHRRGDGGFTEEGHGDPSMNVHFLVLTPAGAVVCLWGCKFRGFFSDCQYL
jgi:hypothetical protein